MSAPAYQSNNRSLLSSVEDVPLDDVRLDLPDHCEAADATRFGFRGGAHQFDGTYTVKDGYLKSTDDNPLLENGNNSASTLPGDMYDNSASKSLIQRGIISKSHRFIGPFASLRRRQTQLARNSRFHGWRMGVLLACCMSFFVLCCNIALLAVGTTRKGGYNVSESGIATFFIGDEAKITRLNTIFHVFINVLSSLLLAGSNYTMQVLSSPTRQEVDTAHRQRDWLAIGLLSPRNWKRISRRRALLCLILGLSSVPLHLLYAVFLDIAEIFADVNSYNATIFKVVVRNIYSSSAIDMHSSNYTALAANTSYVKLTNEEWKSSFSGMYSSSYSNLMLVFDEIEVTTTYNRTRQPKIISITRGDFSFVYGAGYNLASKVSESNRLSWTEHSPATPGVSIHIAHALAAPSHTRSRVQLSLNFMIVVISANVLKLLVMLGVLITDRSNYLVTLGDAATSFLSNPDPTTEGKCLLEDEALTHENKPHGQLPQPGSVTEDVLRDHRLLPETATDYVWHSRTLRYFALIRNEQARFTLLAIVSLIVVFIGFVATTSGTAWAWGASSDGALSFGSDSTSAGATLKNAWLANMPQLLLSFCYMNINSFCTAITGAEEWNNLSRTRKALRVSEPRGQQRNTYFLQLPYRWSLPLLVLGMGLHWLLSQTFFLVRLDVLNVDGQLIEFYSRSACGVSAASFLVFFVLFMSLCIAIRHLASRKIVTGLPQAASNSFIISAACHPPSEEVDPHLKPVQWGVVKGQVVEGREHCSLSSQPVTAPEDGKMYN